MYINNALLTLLDHMIEFLFPKLGNLTYDSRLIIGTVNFRDSEPNIINFLHIIHKQFLTYNTVRGLFWFLFADSEPGTKTCL